MIPMQRASPIKSACMMRFRLRMWGVERNRPPCANAPVLNGWAGYVLIHAALAG